MDRQLSSASTRPPPRLLIVEDDQVVAMDLSRTIQELGCETAGIAANAQEALRVAVAERPDLVLMDIKLQNGTDGVTAAEQIRARLPVPVIFLTAYADEATVARTTGTGAFGHLTKPIRLHELRAAISIALRGHRTANALIEKNTWLAALLSGIDEGVVATDLEGRVTFLNPYAERLTGWSTFEAAGKPVDEILQLQSQVGDEPVQSRIVRAGELDVQLPRERFLLRNRRGQEIPVEESSAPLRRDQKLAGAFSIIRDLSETLRFEQAQKLETVGVLAGGVAHDFNNLLAVMIGNASLAQSRLPAGSRERGFLQEVLDAGAKASQLTAQMLAYAGKVTLRKRLVQVFKPIQEITELLRSGIPERIKILVEVSPDLPAIEADPIQIQQVIMNLMINASEAIGELAGTIHISAEMSDAYSDAIFIRVKDTGVGMDAQTRAKIFDPFFSTKFTGRGLGLAAVQGIVRLHDGTIDVDSTPGRGSTFTVVLPVVQSRLDRPAQKSQPQEIRGTETVLVVDDVEGILRFARSSLERYGFSVLAANSGETALEVVKSKQQPVHLVLLDLSMPTISGGETARRLREIDPALPICFMSGYSEETVGKDEQALAVCFLQKPFTPEQLASTVRGVLDRQA